MLSQQVLRAGIADVSGIANIIDIADNADIATDITDIVNIADIADRMLANIAVEIGRRVQSVTGVSRDR